MPELDLKFGTWIIDHSLDTVGVQGPVFHRWLPDGSVDAITIDIPRAGATVRLWCERRGHVLDDKGFIEFKVDAHEVDPSVMVRQGRLDAGALYGSIHLSRVSEAQLQAVKSATTNSEDYVALGKFVIQEILDSTIQQFTRLLRDTFGQYWIKVPESFDSRRLSLGQHCNLLNLKWRAPDDVWREFVPTDRKAGRITLRLTSVPYQDFLTHDDWIRIGEILRSHQEPSLAATVASRASRLLHENRISHALIELVTALEIAVEERVRHALHGDTTLVDSIAPFWDDSLKSRLTVTASLGSGVASSDLLAALKCIEQRHAVVHEGADPGDDASTLIPQALRVVGALAVPPILKRPPDPGANELRVRAEDWDA